MAVFQTRVWPSNISSVFLTVALVFGLIALASDSWSYKRLSVDGGFRRMTVSRGLWSMSMTNSYGVYITSYYNNEDQLGSDNDPFCGSSSAISIFEQYLPLLASIPSSPPNPTYLKPGTCCGGSDVFSDVRTDRDDYWCELKLATKVCAVIGVVVTAFATVAASIGRFRPGGATIIASATALLASATLLGAVICYGVWLKGEQNQLEGGVHDSITDYEHGGVSLVLIIIAMCLAFFAGAAEVFAACSTWESEPLPPPVERPGMASMPPPQSQYYDPITGKPATAAAPAPYYYHEDTNSHVYLGHSVGKI